MGTHLCRSQGTLPAVTVAQLCTDGSRFLMCHSQVGLGDEGETWA